MNARAALSAIAVVVAPPTLATVPRAADALPSSAPFAVMHEIGTLVDRLLATGESGRIDLRSLPLSPADLQALRAQLGDGAVQARIDALGESEICETAFPGVWWIVHRDAGGDVMAELIEVAAVPSILAGPPEDIAAGRERLRRALAGDLMEAS